MIMSYALMLLLMSSSPAKNCGASEYQEEIDRTNALIMKAAPLDSFVGEFPTPSGTPECARVKFSIDSDGHAKYIRIVESSGNIVVDMAVVRSVKKYVFRREYFRWFRTYMLIFEVDYNKIPPNYFHGTQPVGIGG